MERLGVQEIQQAGYWTALEIFMESGTFCAIRLTAKSSSVGSASSGVATTFAAKLLLPYRPRAVVSCFHTIERDLVLECIHCAPEAVVFLCPELAHANQTLKRLLD